MLELHKTIRVLHIILCTIVFILFYDQDWEGRVFKVMKNKYFFSIFWWLGYFPQVIGQVKEWLMLKLHKIIRVSHANAFTIIFILFYD